MASGVLIPWLDEASFTRARAGLGDRLPSSMQSASFDEYRREVERDLRILAAARIAGVGPRGVALIDGAALDALAADEATRGSADEVDLTPLVHAAEDAGRVTAWPPGRNEPCWCGSGTKYKRCCSALPIDAREVAAEAAELRSMAEDLANIDLPPEHLDVSIDGVLDEFDEIARDLEAADAPTHDEVIEDVRFELVGGTHYAALLELAARSEARHADDADRDLAPLLAHELCTAVPALPHHLRLVYAEALGAEGRDHAAFSLAAAAIRGLDAAGAPVTAVDRAIAISHAIDGAGAATAEYQFDELLERLPDHEHVVVYEIAADCFRGSIEYGPAVKYGELHLRALLEHTPGDASAIAVAAATLRRTYDESDSFAAEAPTGPAAERDLDLLARADAAAATAQN